MRKPFITVRLTHGMLGALLVSTCACSGTKWTEVEKDFYPYRYPARRSCIRIFRQFGGETSYC